jgi:hypothetical protein
MTITRSLLEEIISDLPAGFSDWTLEALLRAMEVAFDLLGDYRENIQGFDGVYVFESKDGKIQASAVFKSGRMETLKQALDAWDCKIVFKDARAFWKLLLAGGNDVLDAVLENDVEVYGNLNYLYKFGFMVRDLVRRLGLPVRFAA